MVCTLAAAFVFVGVVMADTFPAIITKVEDGKVTFYKGTFNKEEKKFDKATESTTLPTTADVKVSKGKFDKDAGKIVAGDAVEGGLKHEMFGKISDKGVFGTITTDDDNKKVKEIIVFGGKKGGGK